MYCCDLSSMLFRVESVGAATIQMPVRGQTRFVWEKNLSTNQESA